jgi:hypothetical protein
VRTARLAPLALAALVGCGAAPRPYPNRPVVWVDPDRHLFAGPPEELYTPPRWDAIDHTIFRQLSEVFTFEAGREAINANALDEVPDSSWFENRTAGLTPDDVARGACGDDLVPPTPWRVVERKTTGTRPGFLIEADGVRYFVRTDDTLREQGSAADAIATRLIWAAGYHTPCNHVAFVRPDELLLAGEEGDEDAPTQADLDLVVERATRAPDGRLRLSVSRFVEGRPLGGWQFWGVREDDPNDVVPHEHRRDVRGMVVLSAWLNRIDSRSENNHDAWVEVRDGLGYVRHYVLDASDSFGIVWHESYLMAQRFGASHYFDLQHLLEDFLTLGLLDRPYYVPDERRGPAAHIFGYYDVERFDPDGWRNGYPNPAFERATERDRAWMARILARLGPSEVEAAVRTGALSRPLYEAELMRILLGRRARILERYLTRLSPLASPVVRDGELCLDDLAAIGGIRPRDGRRYAARVSQGWPPNDRGPLPVHRGTTGPCVVVPSVATPTSIAPADTPVYTIVELTATSGDERVGVVRVHLYEIAPGELRVVGLERPPPT